MSDDQPKFVPPPLDWAAWPETGYDPDELPPSKFSRATPGQFGGFVRRTGADFVILGGTNQEVRRCASEAEANRTIELLRRGHSLREIDELAEAERALDEQDRQTRALRDQVEAEAAERKAEALRQFVSLLEQRERGELTVIELGNALNGFTEEFGRDRLSPDLARHVAVVIIACNNAVARGVT